ncbi:MAG: ABC transporter ATP-binding protein [Lachnospiraceae bacterium]|nr:ABC transporter ATP-binding protein [Lachnospiraceae bacterium]
MITAQQLTKRFDDVTAVNGIDLVMEEGQVFGLIGTNGAGKSTFFRMLAGIIRPDEGTIRVDGEAVFENEAVKRKLFYISDDQFSFANATPEEMAEYYRLFYPAFDCERLYKILDDFGLDKKRKIKTFSKGMKKQASLLTGICSGAKYLLLDETFDGLDPVMRQAAKSLLASNMIDAGQTPIIASHNLRELEDICDHVGLLHKGGILLSKDLITLREGLHRIQLVLKEGMRIRDLTGIDIIKKENRGKVYTLTVRGDETDIRRVIESYEPVFYEVIPLSLEEIFISETEVAGYELKSLIF